MASNHKIERAREAVVELLKASNPQDELLLISVADKPQLQTGFTQSTETIDSALVSLVPQGSTALLDGIYLAVSQMKNARYSRKALLIISDGGDNHSRYDEGEIMIPGTFSPLTSPTGRKFIQIGYCVRVLTKRVAMTWTSSTSFFKNKSRAKDAIALASENLGVS